MSSPAATRTSHPDWVKLPHAEAGNRIGIFGGSFNPPHSGHRAVAMTAMKRLKLDQVWWLVTPGNPLKDAADLAPLDKRIHMTSALADHPRMRVTAHEVVLGTPYTAETLKRLCRKRPDLNFVWIMGADNLASFHRWQDWRTIMDSVPVAVVDRPHASLSVLFAPMAQTYGYARIDEGDAVILPHLAAPAWTFLHAPLDGNSSTELRKRQTT
ncbi:nicotinate-nucleotide adenylyltransferase [Roseibium limicola]|uniref:Probable nicotinate-nucleotide adenylyltransferase n=1 Tax=Roseibium limicola TaxID=2816037 RepID=A0A939ER54_9HYPH|nr:nicotinate-nucleotide adenylyltransferase [Roseibium limicola]MBO0345559.1 nicotinate-nucleotide adenylyltransferase [Roseibium limicola]